MMNYMKSVKQTLINWEKENRTIAWVLIGAIGLPLTLGLAALFAWLLAVILVFFGMPWNLAVVTEFFILIGGFIGYVASKSGEYSEDVL